MHNTLLHHRCDFAAGNSGDKESMLLDLKGCIYSASMVQFSTVISALLVIRPFKMYALCPSCGRDMARFIHICMT